MITVDPASGQPPYSQIRAQITAQAASGALPPGTRLPPVRRLAADLGLAANTVARAYRELEHDGVVATHGRNGTVITAPSTSDRAATDAAAEATATQAAVAYAQHVRHLGLPTDLALRLVRDALGNQALGSEARGN
jgi:DNA-binding transcriptional regulator YhcF (GntR family)